MLPNRIVAIGSSAGGIETLCALFEHLPASVDAAFFVTQHLSPSYQSKLPSVLNRCTRLKAVHPPTEGMVVERGMIYVAPSDHHLLVEGDRVFVARGPKENRFRPSVDALFRSVAYVYGPRAIGVVLSGALDDGTSGLWSIKRLGGVAVVQDPAEATFDSMPVSAIEHVEIDYSLPVAAMAQLVMRLAAEPVARAPDGVEADRQRMRLETSILADGDAFSKGVTQLGDYTPFTCPECAGVLVRVREGGGARFRCHTGHGYTSGALIIGIVEKTEAGYWAVMRGLEEAAMLLDAVGGTQNAVGDRATATLFREEAARAKMQSRELRRLVLSEQRVGSEAVGAAVFGAVGDGD
ncbi:chemotaxis protein CheB [Robbsia sp. Bb-Pol-6]|uniref:protein-glutamate methylesterase n=1 Tax=Robbsia betulipollinis TaxID=2981849 RepID=A0ABT3ZJ46_9BURK|nr:chemotaxis protein CheB [Robbsia betulipollinis]MCY0386561.1 chemotaxis protein CheB [Robbsia betulipollinis]